MGAKIAYSTLSATDLSPIGHNEGLSQNDLIDKIKKLHFYQESLDLKEMQDKFNSYKLNNLFALTSGEQPDTFILYISEAVGYWEYCLKIENNKLVTTTKRYSEDTRPPSAFVKTFDTISKLLLEARGKIPYFTLYQLEKEQIYYPSLSGDQLRKEIIALDAQITDILPFLEEKELNVCETFLLKTSTSDGQLSIYYCNEPSLRKHSFYKKTIENFDLDISSHSVEKLFDGDFNLKMVPYG